MTKTKVTTNDLKDFFAAYGVIRPIDLSRSTNPGWQLRESMEGLTSQFVETESPVIANGYIRLDQLKKVKGTSARVYNAMANGDGEAHLSFYELALGLEKAELLKLPSRESTATLWQSPGSVQWGILKHDRQSELANYLDSRRNDTGRGNALVILEAWAQKTPSDFEGTFTFDGRIIGVMLTSKDSLIRDCFLSLFQTPAETPGAEPLEGFSNLERDFESLLSRLRTQDLGIVKTLLGSSNPRKVVFGLLCAKRLLSKSQFTATCRGFLPERSSLASQIVCRTEKRSVTLGQLVQDLVQNQNGPAQLARIEY